MYDHSNVPTVICDLFTKETAIHSHCTRFRSNSYHIPANVNRHSIVYIGPTMWAKLPPDIRDISSHFMFQKKFKQQLQLQL